MRRTIFDLLDKEIDYKKEYEKLYLMITNDSLLHYGNSSRYKNIFNLFIKDWEYRATARDFDEVISMIFSNNKFTDEENCLYLIELILNIRAFFLYKNKESEDEKVLINGGLVQPKTIRFNDQVLIDIIDYVLNKLGYVPYKEEKYKVILIKKDADAISTALVVKEENLINLIMDYNDFRIHNDLLAKKDILVNFGQYLEPLRNDLEKIDKTLSSTIFFNLNNLHLRHNNKSGKDKSNYVAKLSDTDLIVWYDKLYYLILLAFRLLELPNKFKEFKELKKNIIEVKEEV